MLTDTQCRNAKPADKQQKLWDDGGLFLLISPTGGKWWRLKYRHGGKEKLLSLGTYPLVSLKAARERRDSARRLLSQGIDPSAQRRQERAAVAEAATNTFEAVALEWFQRFSSPWSEGHRHRVDRWLRRDTFPWLGKRPVKEITASELLTVLRRAEDRGAIVTAHRVRRTCSEIFRYAIVTKRADRNPADDLKGALSPWVEKHHPSITDPKHVGALLRALDGYHGAFATRCALRLSPLVFLRPSELREAEWTELNFDTAEWRIPAERMKEGEQHIVPLSRQALSVLRELQPVTGGSRFLFPSLRTDARPMSNNTVNAAMRRMGFGGDEMTGHGFRSMASTLLNEKGWNPDAIERQLAHRPRNQVRAAYNHAQYLAERREMMQAWADYLDELRAGEATVPIHHPAV